jgi:hypothetical protein
MIGMLNIKGITILKNSEITIADRYSTGSTISKEKLLDAFITSEFSSKKELESKEAPVIEEPPTVEEESFTSEILKEVEVVEVKKEEPKVREKTKEEINLREIDDKLLTIEDFLNSD